VLKDRFPEGLATMDRRGSVQFIHESVREYLLGSGREIFDPDLSENTVGRGTCALQDGARAISPRVSNML
jgi:hypothetical protein